MAERSGEFLTNCTNFDFFLLIKWMKLVFFIQNYTWLGLHFYFGDLRACDW